MDLVLIIVIFGLQTTLFLMGIFTLKGRINSLEEQVRVNTMHLDLKLERLNTKIEEKSQFNEKALGQLAENVAACGYEVKAVKDKIDSNTKEIKEDIKQSTHTIAVTPLKIQI